MLVDIFDVVETLLLVLVVFRVEKLVLFLSSNLSFVLVCFSGSFLNRSLSVLVFDLAEARVEVDGVLLVLVILDLVASVVVILVVGLRVLVVVVAVVVVVEEVVLVVGLVVVLVVVVVVLIVVVVVDDEVEVEDVAVGVVVEVVVEGKLFNI